MLLEQALPELRAGKKIRRTSWEEGRFIAMLGEGLIIDQSRSRDPLLGMGMNDWEVVKEETWEDKVSKDNPYLCWVSDDRARPMTGHVALIVRCNNNNTNMHYYSLSGASWRCAKPLSKEEVNSLGNLND